MPVTPKLRKAIANYYKGSNEPKEIQKLIECNIYMQQQKISHDECLKWLLRSFKNTSKKNIIENFLYGIQQSTPEYRAAFSAYSVALNLPNHIYHGTDIYCDICGAFEMQNIDLTMINCIRYLYGSLRSMTPADLALNLQMNTNLPQPTTLKNDIFIRLLEELIESPQNETPSSLLKRLNEQKFLNIPKDEIRGLLETLGFAGILQSPSHLGYIYKYTPPFSHAANTSKSDWRYPVDFWTGIHGINRQAISFWFSGYPNIVKLIR
ncbi:hypothetical protein ACJ70E_10475 [Pseudomonas plecoglossicida]|uniref:hypothetical protein n=1 Tax=Pseudomonas plecoglossicida TaxID=70775 RepID=UPI0039776310